MGPKTLASCNRVLITGCNGFIGTALATEFLARGRTVSGSVRSHEKKRCLPPGVEAAVTGEIGPLTDWSAALAGVDAVVHLAAKVHDVSDSKKEDRSAHYKVNEAGTVRLALAAAEAGVKRLLFMSTIKVQGEGTGEKYTENDPEDPQNPYARSKLGAEHALKEIAARTRLEVVILRPPMVYGPGVRANFRRLMGIVDRRIPLPLASVANRRGMLFLGNLIDAIWVCLQHPLAAGQTYLVADRESPSTPQLIRAIAAELGVPARLFPCPESVLRLTGTLTGRNREIERLISSLWADTSKIQQELSWRPLCSLPEGLAATVSNYRLTQRPPIIT